MENQTTTVSRMARDSSCTRPLPLPPVRPTTYAQARNLAQQYPEHAAIILKAPLATQKLEAAPRTYAQARTLAATQPECAAEILSRPLASNPNAPDKVKEVAMQSNARVKPRSPFRKEVRRAIPADSGRASKRPAGPRSQTQPRRRSQVENQSPVPLSNAKKPPMSIAAPVKAVDLGHLNVLVLKDLQPEDTAQIIVSKSEIWTRETAVVPAVRLPARPAINSPLDDVGSRAHPALTPFTSNEAVGVLNIPGTLSLSDPIVDHISASPQPPANDATAARSGSSDGEERAIPTTVVNGTAYSAAVTPYVFENAVPPVLAPSSSSFVSVIPKFAPSPSPAVGISTQLALPASDEDRLRPPPKNCGSSTAVFREIAALSPPATASPDLDSERLVRAVDIQNSSDTSYDQQDVRLAENQVPHSPLSPSSLRITPTRRKSALELATIIAAQNPGHAQMQGTPPHTTVDRLRLAIAAERALSRRPDVAARINLAFASTSAAPAVVATPLTSSMRFVRPAPQYAFKRPHRPSARAAQATAVRPISAFVANGRSPRAQTTPYGELLGYVEVDAW